LVAARSLPLAQRRRGLALIAGAVGLIALGLPSAAWAHAGGTVKALDFQARVASTGRERGVVSASVVDGDRKLEVRVAPTSTVLVLGYIGEPFLRFSASGVDVNERSLSAIANKLARRGSTPALDPHASPRWWRVSKGSSYAWHDHRLGPTPGFAYQQGDVTTWTIPTVVDGRPDRIVGRLSYAHGPPLWPWVALLGATLLLGITLATRSRRLVEAVLFLGAAIAGLAALILTAAFSFPPARMDSVGWETIGGSFLLALVVLAIFVLVPAARRAVAAFVAVLAALVGLSTASVLVHGYVISSLPAVAVRAATIAALGTGLIAAACEAGLHLDGRRDRPRTPARPRQRQMAVPGEKAGAR
jgi:hypothetical protein